MSLQKSANRADASEGPMADLIDRIPEDLLQGIFYPGESRGPAQSVSPPRRTHPRMLRYPGAREFPWWRIPVHGGHSIGRGSPFRLKRPPGAVRSVCVPEFLECPGNSRVKEMGEAVGAEAGVVVGKSYSGLSTAARALRFGRKGRNRVLHAVILLVSYTL